jgi:hypothetical protein
MAETTSETTSETMSETRLAWTQPRPSKMSAVGTDPTLLTRLPLNSALEAILIDGLALVLKRLTALETKTPCAHSPTTQFSASVHLLLEAPTARSRYHLAVGNALGGLITRMLVALDALEAGGPPPPALTVDDVKAVVEEAQAASYARFDSHDATEAAIFGLCVDASARINFLAAGAPKAVCNVVDGRATWVPQV